MEIHKFDVTAREQDGVWFQHGDASFLVCSLEKPEYKRTARAKAKPYRRQLIRGTMADETVDRLAIEAMAEHILIDWKGLTEKGQAVPYSKAKAVQLLTDFPKFRDLISDFANDQAAFEAELDNTGVESLKKD